MCVRERERERNSCNIPNEKEEYRGRRATTYRQLTRVARTDRVVVICKTKIVNRNVELYMFFFFYVREAKIKFKNKYDNLVRGVSTWCDTQVTFGHNLSFNSSFKNPKQKVSKS